MANNARGIQISNAKKLRWPFRNRMLPKFLSEPYFTRVISAETQPFKIVSRRNSSDEERNQFPQAEPGPSISETISRPPKGLHGSGD